LAESFLPGDATYLLGLIRDHKVRKGCFWHALAELRRLKLISEGRLPNPLETLMIEIAILCDMSHNFEQQIMNPTRNKNAIASNN
jgi:hypothetical protein